MHKIMIVDDDVATFEQIKLILSKESDLEVKFECCRHDKLAQSIFKAAEYALVIIEICSTDIDGYELIRHIKSISHTPIVALSRMNKWDESSITQIEVAKSLGAEYALCKPDLSSKLTE